MARPRTRAFYRKRLPHWEVDHDWYFVTIRQRGSLPREVVRRLRREHGSLGADTDPARRRFVRELETWLDGCYGPCDLARPPVADMLRQAIEYRAGSGVWSPAAFVIMPNHVHLLLRLEQDDLFRTMVDFKRWTGRSANALLEQSGPFWQREWFDHWVRSASEGERIAQYIRRNPVKAGLVDTADEWPFGWIAPHWGTGV